MPKLAALPSVALAALSELPGVGVLVYDDDLRIRFADGGAMLEHGYRSEEIVGRLVRDVASPDSREKLEDHYRAALRGERRHFEHRLPTGGVFLIEVGPLHGAEGDVAGGLAVMHDVSARREAEDRYRLLAENSSDVVSLQSPDSTFLWVSPSVTRVLGYTPAELVGRSAFELSHPDDLDLVQARHAQVGRGEDGSRATSRLRHRDGSWRWVETSSQMVTDSETGAVVAGVFARRDVTDRVIAEQELSAAQAALERSNHDLERVASVASHDLITPIASMLQELRSIPKEGLPDEVLAGLGAAEKIGEQMYGLVNAVLGHARVDHLTLADVPVDLGVVAAEAVAVLNALLCDRGADVRIGQLGEVRGDHVLLRQLVQNLIANAVVHHPGPGARVLVHAEPRGEEVVLVVEDDGDGIPAERREDVFGVFAREAPGGHGIGLATAKRVVERHDGRIWIEDAWPHGARICCALPRAGGRGLTAPAPYEVPEIGQTSRPPASAGV